MNILVVDDAKFMRTILKSTLEKEGFNVVGEAVNGFDALQKYIKLKPDVVTMDITMPEMNGIDAVKAIKALDSQAKIIMVSAMGQQPMVIEGLRLIREYDKDAKVIMCSAMGQRDYVMEAVKLGALDFIVKPFDNEKVINALRNALVAG